jgi:hypothetical protein
MAQQPKFQIFVSSTYEDLKEHRDAVIRLILEIGHIPVGMEMFSAGDDDQWRVIQRTIDQCDYYVVIVAHRYGSMRDGVSYTELEFDYAVAQGVPAFGFLIKPQAEWNATYIDVEHKANLDEFKAKVKRKMVGWWDSTESLRSAVAVALLKGFVDHPRRGWVQAQPNDAIVAPEVARLSAENAELRQQLESLTSDAKKAESDELRATMKKLIEVKRTLSIWTMSGSGWEKLPPKSLADIFYNIAPGLMAPATAKRASAALAAGISAEQPRLEWPIAANLMDDLLSEFAALELVVPIRSHVPASGDGDQYWKLTKKGRGLLHWYQRLLIDREIARAAKREDKSTQSSTPSR